MTIYFRTLAAELLKLRRTLAFWMVLLAPLLIVGLQFLVFHERVEFFSKRHEPLWDSLHRNILALWSILMLPLYVTLQTALLAGMEHNDDRWRSLLAMPVPRWAIYWAKLAIPCAMVAISSVILAAGALGSGLLLRTLKPQLLFPDPLPWAPFLRGAGLATAASMLVIAIHHALSLRLRTFAASAGAGVAATLISFVLINSERYSRLWPWCLPARMLSQKPGVAAEVLLYSLAGAVVVSVLGTWEFSRREIR